MALEEGSTNAVVRRNITKLRNAGYSLRAAKAIALRRAGRDKKTRKRVEQVESP